MVHAGFSPVVPAEQPKFAGAAGGAEPAQFPPAVRGQVEIALEQYVPFRFQGEAPRGGFGGLVDGLPTGRVRNT